MIHRPLCELKLHNDNFVIQYSVYFEMYIWIHSSLILKNALWIFFFFLILLTKEEIETQ